MRILFISDLTLVRVIQMVLTPGKFVLFLISQGD